MVNVGCYYVSSSDGRCPPPPLIGIENSPQGAPRVRACTCPLYNGPIAATGLAAALLRADMKEILWKELAQRRYSANVSAMPPSFHHRLKA